MSHISRPVAMSMNLQGRQQVRILKRHIHKAISEVVSPDARVLGQASIIKLLERSMRLGHDRLAIKRLREAVLLKAEIDAEHWQYCREIAERSCDLQEQYLSLASLYSLC